MKKLLVALAILATGCDWVDDRDLSWDDPVIPVTLTGIEAMHVDNAGEFPVVSGDPIKKEAYMLGVKWKTSQIPGEDDKFVTDPVKGGGGTADYSKAIICLTPFNVDIPAGTYVSSFFKEADGHFLPEEVDEGFVLLVTPDPGQHAFRVEYYENESDETPAFSYDTPTIELR